MISLATQRPSPGLGPDRMPQTGDVVIRRAGPDATPIYAMSTVPGPDQCGCATRTDTEQVARRFAGRCGVNLWFTENSRDFTLLASFRPVSRQQRPTRAIEGPDGASHVGPGT